LRDKTITRPRSRRSLRAFDHGHAHVNGRRGVYFFARFFAAAFGFVVVTL
jgi:hypothetical protein